MYVPSCFSELYNHIALNSKKAYALISKMVTFTQHNEL